MDRATTALKEKLNRLLEEAAEVSVALDRADGTVRVLPHYSVIEGRAHELGRLLSRTIQARQMAELVSGRMVTAACPSCATRCQLEPKPRTLTSIDGPVEVQELQGHCPVCRRAFFPRQTDAGL
jgi:hypothetical protein